MCLRYILERLDSDSICDHAFVISKMGWWHVEQTIQRWPTSLFHMQRCNMLGWHNATNPYFNYVGLTQTPVHCMLMYFSGIWQNAKNIHQKGTCYNEVELSAGNTNINHNINRNMCDCLKWRMKLIFTLNSNNFFISTLISTLQMTTFMFRNC